MEEEKAVKINYIKVLIDILLLNIVGWSIKVIAKWATPFKRGVFCNDQSIQYPVKGETIPFSYLENIGFPSVLVIIVIVEFCNRPAVGQVYVLFGKLKFPEWIKNVYQNYGVFLFGECCSQLTTDTMKNLVGRLRPYFLEGCMPDVCQGENIPNIYHIDFNCTNEMYLHEKKFMMSIRLSFPSGHSSFALYVMLFLIMYLQKRLTWSKSKLLKPTIQLLAIGSAICVGLTRISDYKHHWSDVLAGFLIGGICAIVSNIFFTTQFPKISDTLQDV